MRSCLLGLLIRIRGLMVIQCYISVSVAKAFSYLFDLNFWWCIKVFAKWTPQLRSNLFSRSRAVCKTYVKLI